MADITVELDQVDALSQLQAPAGYNLVQSQQLIDFSLLTPDQNVVVETYEFQTPTGVAATLAGDILPNVFPSVAQTLDQQIAAAGSQLFWYALYQQTLVNIQIPTSFTIPSTFLGVPVPGGGTTIPIPGGGTVLLQVDDYQLIMVHEQIAFAIALVIAVFSAYLVYWMVKTNVSPFTAASQLIGQAEGFISQTAAAAGGAVAAPVAALSNGWIWVTLAAFGLAVLVAVSNKDYGLGLQQPPTPTPQPPNVSVSTGVGRTSVVASTPAGGGGRAAQRRRS